MRALILASALLILPLTANAQTAGNIEAENFIANAKIIESIEAQSNTLASNMVSSKFKALPANMQQNLNATVQDELQKSLTAHRADFKNDLVPVLTKYFTAAELRDINDFVKTSTGQKLIAAMPAISKDIEAVGKKWSNTIQGEVVLNVGKRLMTNK